MFYWYIILKMPNVCENAKWRRNRILNALYLFRWLYIVFINKTHKACYQALSTLDFTWVIYLMINIDNIRANFLSGIFLVVICYRAALCTHIETSASQMLSFIFIVRSDSFTEVLSPFFMHILVIIHLLHFRERKLFQ